MEGDEVFCLDQNFDQNADSQLNIQEILASFNQFIREWLVDNQFIYKQQLLNNGVLGNYVLSVLYSDIESFNVNLS